MTYELDCSGVPLVLRVFFPLTSGPSEWRIEARVGKLEGGAVASASGESRAQALSSVAGSWKDSVPASLAVDWKAVTDALISVRAI